MPNLELKVGLESAVTKEVGVHAGIRACSPTIRRRQPNMLNDTTQITGWLHRLALKMATSVPLSHLATGRGHCPHCEQETPWAVHAMSGFYRCRRCGHDPLDESSHTPEA